jgi:RimJ/RimL family protein N-acetyltransferase
MGILHSAPAAPPTTLSDGIVTLRSWQAGDAPALYEATRKSISTVSPWLSWLDTLYKPEDADHGVTTSQAHWQRQAEFRFAVWDASTSRLLGGAGLNHLNLTHRFGNLGYWVRSSATGTGVAARAARLVARFGLATAELGGSRS